MLIQQSIVHVAKARRAEMRNWPEGFLIRAAQAFLNDLSFSSPSIVSLTTRLSNSNFILSLYFDPPLTRLVREFVEHNNKIFKKDVQTYKDIT